jgi:hypothetical protein
MQAVTPIAKSAIPTSNWKGLDLPLNVRRGDGRKEHVGNAGPQAGDPDGKQQRPGEKSLDDRTVTARDDCQHDRHHQQKHRQVSKDERYRLADHRGLIVSPSARSRQGAEWPPGASVSVGLLGNPGIDYSQFRQGLAIPAGFEPATHGVEIRYSIQLSYGTVETSYHFQYEKSASRPSRFRTIFSDQATNVSAGRLPSVRRRRNAAP